ncbi:uncharacterized protein LOC134537728 [Bacillus rossius redtenbacheri]|uniref:uncharacterized protein LOC134537728 n=1 Tax=Bacillus rossius redtenbacheri TaxID=93214 RepID=UPI002FDEDE66
MLVLTALALALGAWCGMVLAAVPDHPAGVLGSRKLGAAPDCSGVVAFSGAGARARSADSMLAFSASLTDRGVGWSSHSGEFTCHCPGLYQLSFAGYGSPEARVVLKRQASNHTEWSAVLSTGPGGGANIALIDMDVGDKAALFLQGGALQGEPETSSFSGLRVAKK